MLLEFAWGTGETTGQRLADWLTDRLLSSQRGHNSQEEEIPMKNYQNAHIYLMLKPITITDFCRNPV
jgi:hypothetical protein